MTTPEALGPAIETFAGGRGLLGWLRGNKLTVSLHDGGYSYTADGNTRTVRWQDVAVVSVAEAYRYTRSGDLVLAAMTLTVRTSDDRQLSLDQSFRGVKRLADEIERCSLPYLSAPIGEAWRSGTPIQLGPLKLDELGIRWGDDFMPWIDLADAGVELGKLELRGLRVVQLDRGDIPNCAVLLWLIDEMLSAMRNDGGRTPGEARVVVGLAQG